MASTASAQRSNSKEEEDNLQTTTTLNVNTIQLTCDKTKLCAVYKKVIMSTTTTNDYFKIVAVLKKRAGGVSSVSYSFIPHKWESEGNLFWPQSNLSKLRSDPTTEPQSDWKIYKCKVKKTNIIGLEEAELWEEEFVNSGTDAESR